MYRSSFSILLDSSALSWVVSVKMRSTPNILTVPVLKALNLNMLGDKPVQLMWEYPNRFRDKNLKTT